MNSYRRSLQRAHLRKLTAMVLRETAVPEDAQTLARQNLLTLRGQLQAAVAKPGLKTSLETRAHLNESIARIDDVLKANMQRGSFQRAELVRLNSRGLARARRPGFACPRVLLTGAGGRGIFCEHKVPR